jgi:ubiquinone/menaquinone biosynthesis C-methylase UbiE
MHLKLQRAIGEIIPCRARHLTERHDCGRSRPLLRDSKIYKQALKMLAGQVPVVGRVIRQRDALLKEVADLRSNRDALLEQVGELRSNGPHFVTEYTRLVKQLIASHPMDQAMSLAVGGEYDRIGAIAAQIVQSCGAKDGDRLIDFGCGSGRLAKHIGIALPNIRYLGLDVVQELLEYAATKTPPHFCFVLNHQVAIPEPDCSADFVVVFSVFTHLYHEESYTYLRDMRRVLRSGGKLIFSFLESSRHWQVFEGMLARLGQTRELIMFIERPQVLEWAKRMEMNFEGFDPGPPIGQTVAVLRKP